LIQKDNELAMSEETRTDLSLRATSNKERDS